jgi:integrase
MANDSSKPGKRRKLWSLTIEANGVQVRLFERERRGTIYRDVWINGARDRKSLGHADRALAKQQAKALATRLAELHYAGVGPLTLGQLGAVYLEQRGPLLSGDRRKAVRNMIRLLEQHFSRAYEIANLSQHAIDGYVEARRSAALVSPRHRTKDAGVRDGTIRNELRQLLTMLSWAQAFRVHGRPLLAANPLHRPTLPSEQNPRRPLATEARYQALLRVSDAAEPTGRFRCVLTLARETGRRINAICALERSDVLTTTEQIVAALADVGQPIAWADAWPNGAVRWRSANDKRGFESVAPLSKAARAALDAYMARYPRVGRVPLFPGRGKQREFTDQAIKKEIAAYWLARAEQLAELPKLARGGFHPFRRLFASERRHLPAQDVAAAGGWRSLEVMQQAYQHADAAGLQRVLDEPRTAPEAEPTRPNTGTPDSQATAS